MKITRRTVQNFLNFTRSLVMLFFVQPSSNLYLETPLQTAEPCNLYIRTDFWSKFCLLNRTTSCWQAVWRVIFKIRVIFGVWFERRKVDKKANIHKNWSVRTLLWSILNNSAKVQQNRSPQFWAIPFQSLRVFWDTVYILYNVCQSSMSVRRN